MTGEHLLFPALYVITAAGFVILGVVGVVYRFLPPFPRDRAPRSPDELARDHKAGERLGKQYLALGVGLGLLVGILETLAVPPLLASNICSTYVFASTSAVALLLVRFNRKHSPSSRPSKPPSTRR